MARPRVQFSDSDIATILEMHRNGFSLIAISEKLERPTRPMTIRNFLINNGVYKSGYGKQTKSCEACNVEFVGPGQQKFCVTCIPSKAWIQRYRLYGLTEPKFKVLWDTQDGLCGMCNKDLESYLKAHVDHCHDQGHVRGLLCGRCNGGLGYIEDDKLMANAFRYLERHKR